MGASQQGQAGAKGQPEKGRERESFQSGFLGSSVCSGARPTPNTTAPLQLGMESASALCSQPRGWSSLHPHCSWTWTGHDCSGGQGQTRAAHEDMAVREDGTGQADCRQRRCEEWDHVPRNPSPGSPVGTLGPRARSGACLPPAGAVQALKVSRRAGWAQGTAAGDHTGKNLKISNKMLRISPLQGLGLPRASPRTLNHTPTPLSGLCLLSIPGAESCLPEKAATMMSIDHQYQSIDVWALSPPLPPPPAKFPACCPRRLPASHQPCPRSATPKTGPQSCPRQGILGCQVEGVGGVEGRALLGSPGVMG